MPVTYNPSPDSLTAIDSGAMKAAMMNLLEFGVTVDHYDLKYFKPLGYKLSPTSDQARVMIKLIYG